MALQTAVRRTASISALIAAAAVGAYATAIYRKVSPVSTSHITYIDHPSESFCKSATIRNIVNPRGYPVRGDARILTLDIPAQYRDVSHEVLLAQFVKGFFGGRVFAPEAFFLSKILARKRGFSTLPPVAQRPQIWKASEFMDRELPLLHTALFGLFHVGEMQIQKDHALTAEVEESTIDVAYGSDQSSFSGAHRFSIIRSKHDELLEKKDGSTQVKIYFASLICNPMSEEGVRFSRMMWIFHDVYAKLLFREAVAEMKMWLSDSSKA